MPPEMCDTGTRLCPHDLQSGCMWLQATSYAASSKLCNICAFSTCYLSLSPISACHWYISYNSIMSYANFFNRKLNMATFIKSLAPFYLIWLGVGRSGFDSRRGLGISLPHRIQTGSGAHPTSYPMDTGGSSPREKRPERKLSSYLLLLPR
jgi:hypothetical protein